jgi:hypothetical protein
MKKNSKLYNILILILFSLLQKSLCFVNYKIIDEKNQEHKDFFLI